MKCYAAKQSDQAPTFPTCRQLHYPTIAHVLDSISNHYQAPPSRALASFSITREQCCKHSTSQYSYLSLLFNVWAHDSNFPHWRPYSAPKHPSPGAFSSRSLNKAHVSHQSGRLSSPRRNKHLVPVVQGHEQRCFNPDDLHSHIPPPNQNKTSIQTGGKQTQLFLTPASYSI